MKTLYYLPIEPLEERYTQSWYDNFTSFFKKEFENVVVIDGVPLIDYVDSGTFLDMNSTVYYKMSQLQKVAALFHKKAVRDGDIFYVGDIEFWGIETIRYMADLQNIKIKLVGFCHAASYTIEDFIAPAAPYGKYFELGWIKAFDLVFVGSYYHRDAIIDRRIKPFASEEDVKELSNKLSVTGNPLFYEDYKDVLEEKITKKKKLIISNRFDYEKRPNLSLDFAYLLKKRNPDLEIVVTTSRPTFKSNKQWLVDYANSLHNDGIITIKEGLTKAEYHRELAEASVFLSNTIEENFGYCLLEALMFDVAPVVERAFSHTEILFGDDRYLFTDMDQIVPMIEKLLSNRKNTVRHLTQQYIQYPLKTMIREIKELC